MAINGDDTDLGRATRAVRTTIRDHWALFLGEGCVLVFLGLLAIVLPTVATVAIEMLIGWLLLISGVIGLYTTWRMRTAAGRTWSLLSAGLGIFAGIVLLRWPVSGAVSLTLVLSLFFLLEGVATIMFAVQHRRNAAAHWGWMLASGLVDVLLAALLLSGLPATAAWALGLMLGINMILGGWALVMMALRARSLSPPGKGNAGNSPHLPSTRA